MDHAENGTDNTQSNCLALAVLPSDAYRKAIVDIIKDNLGLSMNDCEISLSAASAKGDNFMGVLHRINVKSPNRKELNFILKLPSPSEARREQFFGRQVFMREVEFYDGLAPIYKKFQEEKGISLDGFNHIPFCYKTLTDDKFEGIFLEDLKVSGFEMFDRLKETTSAHVNSVMEVLGRFHAIGLAIKDQKPELIEEYRSLEEIFLIRDELSNDSMRVFFNSSKKQAMTILQTHPNEALKLRVIEVLSIDYYELLESCLSSDLAEPYATVGHGDCWNNNMMFRNENGVPVDIRLLDWQIMRYASPVCDLVYYIFCCTTKTLRDKHYFEFLNTYYRSLSGFLTRLGSDPAKVFPRRAFNDQLLRFGKFGMIMAMIALPIMTSNADDVLDFDDLAEAIRDGGDANNKLDEMTLNSAPANTKDAYKERMDGVFEDVFDLGYI